MKFNYPQRRAILHFEGPMLVLAGPGSGKTTVIINRILSLINVYHVPADSVLAVTFSRASAEEMAERFAASCKGLHVFPQFGTFHSIFLKLIKGFGKYDNIRLSDESEKYIFIRSRLERYSLELESTSDAVRDILMKISRIKCSGDDPLSENAADKLKIPGVPDHIFSEIFASYRKYMSEHGLIDFDDIILLCLRMFKDNPAYLESCRRRYRFILVDEFQDASPAQYETIRLLSGNAANLFVVGDDDQSIYGFRGATPGIINSFLKDYPSAENVLLNINYRCSRNILNSSLKVIGENADRMPKDLIPQEDFGTKSKIRRQGALITYAALSEGVNGSHVPSENASYNEALWSPLAKDLVSLKEYPDRTDEYEHMICQFRKILESGVNDIAVLFRNNADTALLVRMLGDRNIPFEYSGTPVSLTDHFAVKDVMAYINVALQLSKGEPACEKDLVRMINRPVRYITREAACAEAQAGSGAAERAADGRARAGKGCPAHLAAMRRYYSGNARMLERISDLGKDLTRISGMRPASAVRYIRKGIGYDRWLMGFAKEKQTDYPEYENILDTFEEYAKGCLSLAQLSRQLERDQALGTSSLTFPSVKENSGTMRLHIMTMHRAKGLEFDIVYIPDANTGILPSKRSSGGASLAEERRLLYVAMTRARSQLHISWCSTLHNHPASRTHLLDPLFL